MLLLPTSLSLFLPHLANDLKRDRDSSLLPFCAPQSSPPQRTGISSGQNGSYFLSQGCLGPFEGFGLSAGNWPRDGAALFLLLWWQLSQMIHQDNKQKAGASVRDNERVHNSKIRLIFHLCLLNVTGREADFYFQYYQ